MVSQTFKTSCLPLSSLPFRLRDIDCLRAVHPLGNAHQTAVINVNGTLRLRLQSRRQSNVHPGE
jgi:hypothetical protein